MTIKPHLLFCLTVSVGLSACVQTQPLQIPSGDQVSSGIKKFADSFNIFDQTGRQFRQLVADKNYSEAEALFDRAFYEYFEPRYAARPELIQEELGALAQASWDRNFSAQLEAVLPQVKAITDATNSQLWQTQTESLRRAQKLLAELSSNKLLSLTKHNVGSVSGLRVEVNRVSDLARKARPTSFPLTFEPVLENPKLKFAFFEQDFSPAEYRVSLEFQARALQTIFSNVGPQELKKKAVEFSGLLSPESKTQVDQRYFDLRRKELTDSKGKVPISRLALLAKVSDPPFRSNIDGFKNLVKVGFLDLTAESFRNRNVFDFEVEFNKDLEISLEDAKANLFSDKSWESYDFIFVTDLTFAKIKREFKDTQDRKSRFQAGVRQIPNPNYSGAIANYNKALADYNRALADSARQDACATPLACVFIAAAKAAVEGGARKNLETAQAGLSSTPQLLDEPVFQPYAYKEVSVSGNKTARVDYYVIDVREKRYFKSFFEYVDEERFDVVYNVHDNDPEKSRILSRLKTEDMVTAWEKKAPLIPLSQLFNLDNLQQGQSRKLVSLESFLAEFTNKRYASAAPVYSTKPGSAAVSQSEPSVIVDERFDSVVLIKTAAGLGTGFYVTPDLILTAYHVVEKTSLVEISFYGGKKTFGKVIDHDVRLDLALVRPQMTGKPVKIHSGPVRLGSTVEAIGHPKGLEFTITRGVISALRKQKGLLGSAMEVEFVQTDTPISPGNSGGPLFLGDAVIGVNDYILVDKALQNLNFSVSFNEIKAYLDRFHGGGR